MRGESQLLPSSSRRAMTCAWISAAPSKIDRMRASHRMRDTGNSMAKPLPPWICTALSAFGPGDPRREQLRHAGLEIAAAAGVLLPRRVVGELARDHDLDRHHGDLVGDARETDDRLAELHAALRIAERLLHRRLRHADGARRGLDARRLEGRHELLEAEPLDAAKQVRRLHLEAVERDLVFLHAAIAEHLDLGAGHALGRERTGVIAARLFGQQHGDAAIAGLLRIGAHQQRHQVGAHRMRDPGLVALDRDRRRRP